MSYVVYADILLAWIFIINYLTYFIACKILEHKISLIKLVLWSIFSALILESFYITGLRFFKSFYNFIYVCINLILMLFFIKYILKIKSIKGLLSLICYSIAGTILLAGITQIFLVKNTTFETIIPVIIIVCLIIPIIHLLLPIGNKQHKNLLQVSISTKNHTIQTFGYMDTGNSLIDTFSGKPVIILEYSIIKALISSNDYNLLNEYAKTGSYEKLANLVIDGEKIYPITYKTISNEYAIMPGFKLKSIIVNNETVYENIVAAISQTHFSDKNNYTVLLNNNL